MWLYFEIGGWGSSGGSVESCHINLIAFPHLEMKTVDGHQPQSSGLWFRSFCTKHLGNPCKVETDVKYQLVGCWCVEARDGATALIPAVLLTICWMVVMLYLQEWAWWQRSHFILTLRHEWSGNDTTYERCVCSHSALRWQMPNRHLLKGRNVCLGSQIPVQACLAPCFWGFGEAGTS